jgi:hypothetical protein
MPRDEATLLDIAKAGHLVLEFMQGARDVPDLLARIKPLFPTEPTEAP